MLDKKETIRGWMETTDLFMADQLRKVFTIIETPEDIALHNDMVRQIKLMVGDESHNFIIKVVRYIKTRPKNFLVGLANLIKQYSMKGA